VIVDDSLGVGVVGKTGRGTRELRGVMSRVDIVTGTFSKSLGAAGGGYVAGRREVIEWLRQKVTPYLFSVALSLPVAAAAAKSLEILESGDAPLETLRKHTTSVKSLLEMKGFRISGGEHPTLAVFIGDVVPLQKLVNALYQRRFHVNGLCYPVVPEREARVRLEIRANHSDADLSGLVDAFEHAGRALHIT
jgi:glycine C-acetyltransferase